MSDSPSTAESPIPDEDGAAASHVSHETDAPAAEAVENSEPTAAAEEPVVSVHAHADASEATPATPAPAASDAAPIGSDVTPAATSSQGMRTVVPYVEAQYAEPRSSSPIGANNNSWAWTRNWGVRAAAIAAGFVIVSAGAAPFVMDRGPDPRVEETRHLAETIKNLNAKVEALEASRPRDETADLRKAFAEIKANLASTHDATATLAQISARLDKFDHEQDARAEKLAERVDKAVAARTTDIAARIEKLEKKAAAPVVAAVQPPSQPKPAPAVAQQAPPPAQLPKQATLLPPAAGVSKETTGSIAPQNTIIHGWVLREVLGDNAAVVEGRYGEREVAEGDILPGAGRVMRVERRGHGWVVVTSLGVIPMENGVD